MIKDKRLMIKEEGFSLIEVILVIMIIGFIGLLISNLPSAFKLTGTSKHESIAKDIVAKKVEDLRSLSFDSLANGTTQITDTRLSQLPSSTGDVVVEDCPVEVCANDEEIKKVIVKVNWLEGGNNRKVELSTLIAKEGLK